MNKVLIKKKNHFFETYISKVIKQISENNSITSNAKQQLNSVLCIIVKIISNVTRNLTKISKKKTLSDKEVLNAIVIVLPGQLGQNAIQEGIKAVNNYKEYTTKGNTRQNKAGIIFPPSITEKFLRNFGYSKIMVTTCAPVCLAAVIEYITAEIIELASNFAKDNKRIRLTIRDLEMGIRNDSELNELFNKQNIYFLGGGSVPFIHESLLSKKTKKQQIRVTNFDNTFKKTHRFRSGTVALKEIKHFQKLSNCLTFPKFSFEKIVRQIVISKVNSKNIIKISKEVFIILQYFIEQYIVDILKDSNFVAIHAGRVKLMSIDIKLINYLRNKTFNPYNSINNIEDIIVINQIDYDIRENQITENQLTENI